MSDSNFNDDDITLASGLAAFEAKHFARAMKILAPLAEKANVEAMYRCAIIYQNGLGMHANEEAALRMMSAAAEQEGGATRFEMSDSNFNDDDITLASGLAAFEAKHFARAMKILAPL